MRLSEFLDDVFRDRSHVRVLRALDGLPQGLAASVREISRRAGITHPTASRALSLLEEQGVVQVQRSARADLYRFAPKHVVTERIEALFEWEREVQRELAQLIVQGLHSSVREAYLFGSAVWGDMEPGSDIDLALVCAPHDVEEFEQSVAGLAEAIRERFGNRLNALVRTTPLDRIRTTRRESRLWQRILAEGLPLVIRPEAKSSRG